jgi:protein-L-isoaspartate O-methyltransferase
VVCHEPGHRPGEGQVTTQPSLSAAMIAVLGLTGAEKVFEVGTGSRYGIVGSEP